MSPAWQAFFWFLALVCFVIDAAGVTLTRGAIPVKLQSLGLAFFTIPWFWAALDAA